MGSAVGVRRQLRCRRGCTRRRRRPPLATSVPGLLASLVAKSIVQREQSGGATRYRMLESLRQYGRERLRELGDETVTRRRHRDWVGELAASAAVHDAHQGEAFDRVERDLDNVFSALDFCLTVPDEAPAGLRICSDLVTFWVTRGPTTDARRMLVSLLGIVREGEPARAKGLLTAGTLAVAHGDAVAGRPLLEASLELGRATADSRVVGWSLDYLSVVAALEGKPDEAMDLIRTMLALARAMNDPVLLGAALSWRILLVSHREPGVGDDDQSRVLADCERSLAELEKLGEIWTRSWLVLDLAIVRFLRGELALAEELSHQATRLKFDLGDLLGLAYAFELLSWVAASRGDMRRAALLLGGASRLWESTQAAMLAINRLDHDRAVTAVRLHGRPRLPRGRWRSAG
jgi:hypothetical protein